jgi:hypothetical protein
MRQTRPTNFEVLNRLTCVFCCFVVTCGTSAALRRPSLWRQQQLRNVLLPLSTTPALLLRTLLLLLLAASWQ